MAEDRSEARFDAKTWAPLLIVVAALLLVQASYGLCTQDDAYISFRYAQNLVDGHGLVFNPGERVEGYTNFLWTVLFAPFLALGLDPAPVSTSLGMLTSALLLWGTWEAAERAWLAPVLVASFAGLSLEGVQGLETAFYAFCVVMAVRGGRGWGVWAGVAALTRPEGYAVFGVLWLLRRSWMDALLFGLLTVPHLGFRVAYYGDIVPNTFHAKVGDPSQLAGTAAERGVRYLMRTTWTCVPLMLGWAGGMGLLLRRPRTVLVPGILRDALALLAFFSVYVVAVGGDFKGTGRFFIPMLPLLALLAARGLRGVPRWMGPGLAVAAVAWSLPHFAKMQYFAERFAGELQTRRMAGERLAEVAPPDTLIAVHAAGVLPFYAGRPTLDMWGLNDAHIARAEVDDFGKGTAGHERHDYDYVLSRKPDLILPEQGLVTDLPIVLTDPTEFPPSFSDDYEAVSLRLPDDRALNVWRRRDGVLGGGR